MDLESILLEYGYGDEPESEPEISFPPCKEPESEPVLDFDAFNALRTDTKDEDEEDVRVYFPTAAAEPEDEDEVRIYTPGKSAATKPKAKETKIPEPDWSKLLGEADEDDVRVDMSYRPKRERPHTERRHEGHKVDQSADDDYVPPLTRDADFVSAYADSASDENAEEKKESGGFFKRAVKWVDEASLGRHKVPKRRRNKDDAFSAAATAYDIDEEEYNRRTKAAHNGEEDEALSSAAPLEYYEKGYPQPQNEAESEIAEDYGDTAPADYEAQEIFSGALSSAGDELTESMDGEPDFSGYDYGYIDAADYADIPKPGYDESLADYGDLSQLVDFDEDEAENADDSASFEDDGVSDYASDGAYRNDDDYDGFVDYELGDDYNEDIDYERPESEFREREELFPASFKEYLLSIITSLLYRLRGSKGSSRTMQEEEEDLGKEIDPLNASKYYGGFTLSLRKRLRVSLVLLVIMIWINVGLPVPGMLKDYKCASAALLAMQLTVSMLALDVVTTGIMNLVRGKPGAETLAVFSCFLTGADALVVSLGNISSPHVALCCISTASLVGILASSLASCRGLRKALRVPAIGRNAYTVTGEMDVKKHEITLLKSLRPFGGFVRRAEEAPPDEDAFRTAAMPLMIGTLLLAVIVAAVKKSFGDLIFIYSAIFAPGVPIAALLCFALPFLLGSLRIFSSGAAIAGWSGLVDIGRSKNIIVTDRDLFPEKSVSFAGIRICGDSNRAISYAGSMMLAAGCGLSPIFGTLMQDNDIAPSPMANFEYLPGGGMKAIIDGSVVYCGGVELMRLQNIPLPPKMPQSRNVVLLAIDGKLHAIFKIKYEAKDDVRKALIKLISSERHPIFAIRDFNVSPAMLAETFGVSTDGYDFPPYMERFRISAATPGEDSQIAAVICREGLGPLTHVADTGRKMYVAVRANLAITLVSAILGVLLVFIKLLTAGTVSAVFLLLYMLLSAVLVAAVSVVKSGL